MRTIITKLCQQKNIEKDVKNSEKGKQEHELIENSSEEQPFLFRGEKNQHLQIEKGNKVKEFFVNKKKNKNMRREGSKQTDSHTSARLFVRKPYTELLHCC